MPVVVVIRIIIMDFDSICMFFFLDKWYTNKESISNRYNVRYEYEVLNTI